MQGAGSSQQGAYAPIHPMQLDYMYGHCNWMNEVSDQEYWNRPRFGSVLTEAVCLNRSAITGSFDRFDGSEEAMDSTSMLPEVVLRRESRIFGPTLLLVVLGQGITLGRTLLRKITLALGLMRIRCRILWTNDGPLLFMFLYFVSVFLMYFYFYVRTIFISFLLKVNKLFPPVM